MGFQHAVWLAPVKVSVCARDDEKRASAWRVLLERLWEARRGFCERAGVGEDDAPACRRAGEFAVMGAGYSRRSWTG